MSLERLKSKLKVFRNVFPLFSRCPNKRHVAEIIPDKDNAVAAEILKTYQTKASDTDNEMPGPGEHKSVKFAGQHEWTVAELEGDTYHGAKDPISKN